MSSGPATPRACSSQQPGNLNTVCYQLTFEKDDDFPLGRDTLHTRMEHHSPEEHPMAWHLNSIEEEEDEEEEEDTEEQFPTAPLKDDVWMEEPGTCAFMNIHNKICALTLAHTAWITYTSLWIMHLTTWTSATFLTSLM